MTTIAWVLLVLAGQLAIVRVAIVVQAGIAYDPLEEMLAKLLTAGERKRAQKIGEAAGSTPVGRALRVTLARAEALVHARERDPYAAAIELQSTFDRAWLEALRSLGRTRALSPFALLSVCASSALFYRAHKLGVVQCGLCLFTLVLLAIDQRTTRAVTRAGPRVFAGILAPLVDTVVNPKS